MNSGLTNFTNGSPWTESTSSSVSWMRLPARSPPAWVEVCPGQTITTPSPKAPRKPRSSAAWKPLP